MVSRTKNVTDLFSQPIVAANLGLQMLADSLHEQDIPAFNINWRPPLTAHQWQTHTSNGISIDTANEEAFRRIMAGRPVIKGLGIARDVIPGMTDRTILHAGPPITWDRMCGPTRGAVMGALMLEGLAETPREAEDFAASGSVHFAPCHHYHAVGPMAGIVSASMPVWIIENLAFGNVAYCTLNEGLGKVLRYGAYSEEVIDRLRWMADVLYPTLAAAVAHANPIDLRTMIAQALHMGDECHNRNRAGTALLLRALGPALARTCADGERLAQVLEFIDGNDHFFLNLSMPAAKAMLEPAEGIAGCTLITVMARNGTDFGIRLSGAPERWFVAPSGVVDGLYLPGFTAEDANPDIGDSTITETAGFGAFAMAAAPAIARFVGGTAEDALNNTREMVEICHGRHEHFTIPALEFQGTPTGMDIRLITQTGILPRLNTGIAHKTSGIGMVGAGVLRAPAQCFVEAMNAAADW